MNIGRESSPSGLGSTDFGREVGTANNGSLAAALREHSGRMARAEAFRYQLAMGLLGFVGGLMVVVPIVLWMAPGSRLPVPLGLPAQATEQGPAAGGEDAQPALVSAPIIASRSAVRESEPVDPAIAAEAAAAAALDRTLAEAREHIRSGEILQARKVLSGPELQRSGNALFMLAETYDPNVLAALDAMDVHAETPMARLFYEAALKEGVTAAAARLEALQ